jgi:hypothetical protein
VEDQSRKQEQQEQTVSDGSIHATKAPWVSPKLAFVEPRLTKHGDLTKVTGQFFGSFSPTSTPD